MLNVASQSSRGRSRSRSRSTPSVRRYRSSVVARVPRAIRYNGVNRITRWATVALQYNNPALGSPGYAIGATNYTDFGISVSPTGFTIYGSSVNQTFGAWPGATEWSNLYDQLKIEKVEITFTVNAQDPALTSSTTPQAGGPSLLVSTDVNDVATGSLQQTAQQENCRLLTPTTGKPEMYTFKPKYQQLISYTSLASATAARTGYVTSNLDVPHYGVRVSVNNAGTNNITHILQLAFKVYVSLKNVK